MNEIMHPCMGLVHVKFLLLLSSLLLFLSVPASAVQMNGIVISKTRPDQRDEFASVRPFTTYQNFGAVSHFKDTRGQEFKIQNAYIVKAHLITNPLEGVSLLTHDQRYTIEYHRDEMLAIMQRFSASKAYLQPLITEYEGWLKRLASGDVYYNGSFIRSEDYSRTVRHQSEQRQKAEQSAQAEQEDREVRESNRRDLPINIAGRTLLEMWPDYVESLKELYAKQNAIYSVAAVKGSVDRLKKLPRIGDFEVSYLSEAGRYSHAFIGMRDEHYWYAFNIAVTLKVNGQDLINSAEFRAMRDSLAALVPEIAEWLPSALVTAFTVQDFEKIMGKKPDGGEALRNIAARTCNLIISPPYLTDDGDQYQILVLRVY